MVTPAVIFCAILAWLLLILASGTNQKPHVLFLLVDDLGWGDVGFLREERGVPREIQTPNMDRLAKEEGIILRRHYVHSSCTGTRTALQSGRLPVHVQTTLKNPEDPSSGMPRNMTGIAEHMKRAGYRTHYVGKWDVGMATPKHTPHGRGYETSLHYFEHKNDYWTQTCMQSACCRNFGQHHHWEGPRPEKYYNLTLVDLWDTQEPAKTLNGSDYEEFIFLRRMQEIIENHNASEPLFLFYAPHVAHCPLQVPQDYLDKFDFIEEDSQYCQAQTPNILPRNQSQPPFSCRKQYHAMVHLLDDILGQLVDQFKAKGLWNDTLLVLTSDNGGPTKLVESGSTNFDLRGGKYSDWEGGVRAAAFCSGGFVPESRRGVVLDEPMHIVDWYATLPALAGTTSTDAELPPVDALNVWPLLTGHVDKSPRQEIPLSYFSLIEGVYKLIWKDAVEESGWTGSAYPNASSRPADMAATIKCPDGCLFNVADDRGEHENLAEQEPLRLKAMKKRLEELRVTFFENDDVGLDSCPPDINMPCACWMAVNYYGGVFGPYQEIELANGRDMGSNNDKLVAAT